MVITSSSSSFSSKNVASPASAEYSAFLSNPEDVLAIINKLTSDFSSAIVAKLKVDTTDAGGLINSLDDSKSLLSSLLNANSRPIQKVTVDMLKASSHSEEAVAQIFHDSAYRLGANLEESQRLLDDMILMGLTVKAEIKIPMFQQEFDKDNKIKNESIRMISVSEMENLREKSNESDSEKFPGAIQIKQNINSESYSISTIFVNCKNYEISEDDFDGTVVLINNFISDRQSMFLNMLDTISSSLSRIDQSKSMLESLAKNNLSEIQEIAAQKIGNIMVEIERVRIALREVRRSQSAALDMLAEKSEDRNQSAEVSQNYTEKIDPVDSAQQALFNERRVLLNDLLGGQKI